MTPLDLTQGPPRSGRAELDGIAYLPRAIDKTRAELPGGNLGRYIILRPDIVTVSGLFYRRMGITHDEFAAAVRDAQTEDDVAAWLRARVSPELAVETSAKLALMTMDRLPPEFQARVRENHPVLAGRPELNTFFDIFEADDAATFESYR